MQIYNNPDEALWQQIISRPAIDMQAVLEKVKPIMHDVQQRGDDALREYTLRFDGVAINEFLITRAEMDAATKLVPVELQKAIRQAADNIRKFHEPQLNHQEPITTLDGVSCWRRSVAIEKVGLYIPGGTAPLFSTLLMLAIPATIAGCSEIVLCTPPAKDGSIHPAILFAAAEVGVTAIYKVGGAQAIAAMAYGTASIPQVYKICGPGNQYVTAAKQFIQLSGIAIDMPAGPSEVCVWADESANAAYVAADLLSQAEHGVDSQVLLVAATEEIVTAVQANLEKQLLLLPRQEMARAALSNSRAVVLSNSEAALRLVNAYAAEHLIISCSDADVLANRIINAGSIFIGNYSPESVGDYASGTNHTLPTNGFARAYSGVSVDSFVKKITVQKLTKQGLVNIAQTVTTMAEAEGLQAHSKAVTVRLNDD